MKTPTLANPPRSPLPPVLPNDPGDLNEEIFAEVWPEAEPEGDEQEAAESCAENEVPVKGPWEFWATGAWGAVAFVGQMLGATGGMFAFVPMFLHSVPFTRDRAQHMSQVVVQADLLGGVVGTIAMLLVLQVAIIQRQSPGFAEYLGLRRFRAWHLAGWGPICLLVSWIGENLAALAGDYSAGVVLHELASSGAPQLLVLVAYVIAAPIGEELLFRGFLYRGLAASRVGWIGAILLPNLCWALAHPQYDGPGVLSIFATGCVFGLARHFSGSVVLPIILHALENAWFACVVSAVRAAYPQ